MKPHISNSLLSAPAVMFMMCCDMRNFSAVANALGITQSAVSKTMQKFEKELGFELFIRSSRPLALTPEARLLHKITSNPFFALESSKAFICIWDLKLSSTRSRIFHKSR